MARVRTLRPFRDLRRRCDREPGDEFDATPERVAELVRRLPHGFVEVVQDEPGGHEPTGAGLSGLRLAELRAIAAERGIKAPRNATKATLLKLLG